jgi:hypothetical protein
MTGYFVRSNETLGYTTIELFNLCSDSHIYLLYVKNRINFLIFGDVFAADTRVNFEMFLS